MVFGAEQYGQASTESIIRAPILAEISAPRALAPTDRSTLTLDVQNFTGRIAEFTVKVDTDGPLAIDAASKRVTLMPEAKQTLRYQLTGKEGVAGKNSGRWSRSEPAVRSAGAGRLGQHCPLAPADHRCWRHAFTG